MKLKSFTPLFLLAAFIVFIFSSCKKENNATPGVEVTGITPDAGPYSTIVNITGTGFSTVASNNIVKFNNKGAVVQSATSNQLTVEVPKGAGTGPVSVKVGRDSAVGPDFNFTFTVNVSTLPNFHNSWGICADGEGNVYITDTNYSPISKITQEGVASTFAGSEMPGFTDGPGSSAQFGTPSGLAIDGHGNVYVADVVNNRIRKITPDGIVSTLAGNGKFGFVDGPANSAEFNFPQGIAVDGQGNVYVSDVGNYGIRKITPAGVVSTLAGNGTRGFVDGPGSSAEFNTLWGVAVDAQGNVYAADAGNNSIRKITPTGIVSTLAGNGTKGLANGPGSSAEFNTPYGVCVDERGNIFVADTWNNRICEITQKGIVSTLAGGPEVAFADGSGSTAKFNSPYAICTDPMGNIYIADSGNGRVRKITLE